MLRASSEHSREAIDLKAVVGQAEGDGGIAHGALLVRFAEAVIGGSDSELAACRKMVQSTLGPAALVDAAGVCGLFNAIDRVADSTGIPLENEKAAATESMRAQLGIDRFAAGKSGL